MGCSGYGQEKVATCGERGNEPSTTVNVGKFLISATEC